MHNAKSKDQAAQDTTGSTPNPEKTASTQPTTASTEVSSTTSAVTSNTSSTNATKVRKLHPCPHDGCLNEYKQLSGLRYHLLHVSLFPPYCARRGGYAACENHSTENCYALTYYRDILVDHPCSFTPSRLLSHSVLRVLTGNNYLRNTGTFGCSSFRNACNLKLNSCISSCNSCS